MNHWWGLQRPKALPSTLPSERPRGTETTLFEARSAIHGKDPWLSVVADPSRIQRPETISFLHAREGSS
jgi:hypothetical protein